MTEPLVLHATTVVRERRAVLIRGASGSGKSALALELLAWGCALVADDRTELTREGERLVARCPMAIRGLIEARGVGLLQAEALEEAEIAAIVDLDHQEVERLPPWREEAILGVRLPVLHKPLNGPFAAAVLQYLKGGRAAPAAEPES
jgi:HPr kinase/phosphorylase